MFPISSSALIVSVLTEPGGGLSATPTGSVPLAGRTAYACPLCQPPSPNR
jgi:hypothetical protein